ncbi:MAG: hypothetical protein ACE5EF_04675 [Dehalococcoidia bacterium]
MGSFPRCGTAGILLLVLTACAGENGGPEQPGTTQVPPTPTETPAPDTVVPRSASITPDRAKVRPADDPLPPVLHSDEWEPPVPLPYPVNSAGAEDSPFVTPDGGELYFFFTPDPSVPAERQVIDGVTGIYHSVLEDGTWSEPERVWLVDEGDLSLDGCEFVQGDVMWFCSVRAGSTSGSPGGTATSGPSR